MRQALSNVLFRTAVRVRGVVGVWWGGQPDKMDQGDRKEGYLLRDSVGKLGKNGLLEETQSSFHKDRTRFFIRRTNSLNVSV